MTQDEIIELAKQAGYKHPDAVGQCEDFAYFNLEAFSKLVAAKERDRMCKQCNWSKHENATCNETNQPEILGKS